MPSYLTRFVLLATSQLSLSQLATAVDEPLVSAPAPAIVTLGTNVTLQPVVTGPGPMTYKWSLNGRSLPGATSATLLLPSVKSQQAGIYRFSATNVQGTTSTDVRVTVYESQVKTIQARWDLPLNVSTRVWGPAAITWQNVERDYDFIRGTRTPTLRFKRGFDATQFGPLKAVLSDGLTSVTCAEIQVDSSGPPSLNFSPGGSVIWTKGTPIQHQGFHAYQFPYYATNDVEMFATGLPPGIVFDGSDGHNGQLSGTPTKAGHYRIIFTARNPHGRSSPIAWPVQVVEPAQRHAGPALTYAGIFRIEGSGQTKWDQLQGGSIHVRIESSGAVSGTLKFGPFVRRFAAALRSVPEEDPMIRQVLLRLPGVIGSAPIDLHLGQISHHYSDSTLGVDIRTSFNGTDLSYTPEVHGNTVSPFLEIASALPGRYTLLMDGGPEAEAGHGFMTMLISRQFQAQGVGTLANGTGITFSSPVVSATEAPGVLIFQSSELGSMLIGSLLANGQHFPLPEVPFEGNLAWSEAASPGSRLFAEGFANRPLSTSGTRYFTPAPGMGPFTRYAFSMGNARISFQSADSYILTINSAMKAIFPASDLNKLRLDIYPSTGFFTGAAKVDGTTPIPFRGMFVPGHNIGGGYFLRPESKSSSSPINSLKVTVTPPNLK